MIEINYWAVLVATASSMVVGSVWYTPALFGKRWMSLAKPRMNRVGADAWLPIVVTVFVSFVTAWVLAAATATAWHVFGGSYFVTGVAVAAVLWAGFTAARFITHDAFEGRPTSLTVLNIAHELVTALLMGIIIGAWAPAGTI